MQAQHIHAFTAQQHQRQAEAEQQTAEQNNEAAARHALRNTGYNPAVNPLTNQAHISILTVIILTAILFAGSTQSSDDLLSEVF